MNHPTEYKIRNYKSFTIEPSRSYFKGVDFFPTRIGRDEESVKHAESEQEAMELIDERLLESMPLYWTVVMNGRTYTWKWLSDALGFASMFNGELSVQFTNP